MKGGQVKESPFDSEVLVRAMDRARDRVRATRKPVRPARTINDLTLGVLFSTLAEQLEAAARRLHRQ